jgi:hypothetical protein
MILACPQAVYLSECWLFGIWRRPQLGAAETGAWYSLTAQFNGIRQRILHPHRRKVRRLLRGQAAGRVHPGLSDLILCVAHQTAIYVHELAGSEAG